MRGVIRKYSSSRRVRIAAASLAALGIALAFAVTRIMLERAMQRALDEAPALDAIYCQWARSYMDDNRMQAAFQALQMAMDAAPTPSRRYSHALDIVTLLMEPGDWLDARDRMRMAREYLLALADIDGVPTESWRLETLMLQLAIASSDACLRQRAATLFSNRGSDDEIPFDIQAARFDAMFNLAPSPSAIRNGLERMATMARSPRESLAYRRRRLRAMRWALADYPWPAAGRVMTDDLGEALEPDDLEERFRAEVDRLLDSADPATAGEAHLHNAFLAARDGDIEAERLALQGAMKKSPSVLETREYIRLLDLLRQTGRDVQAHVLLGDLLAKPETRSTALSELHAWLGETDTDKAINPLLELIDRYLRLTRESERMTSGILLCAARLAVRAERPMAAERYLAAASTDSDWRVRAEAAMLRADVAAQRGDTNAVMRQLIHTMARYPSHPREYDARFQWVDIVSQLPFADADLVGGVVGALVRVPNDDRTLDGLMMIADRMERYGLYALAESYYRRAVLQGSIRRDGRITAQNAEATLGQARVLIAMGRDVEANRLLRALNANTHWARVWRESGPLWASIAIRQGQFMEAARRWRQVCGPPNDPVLSRLFGILVPDLATLPIRNPSTARQPPAVVPPMMMRAMSEAVVDRLLQDGDSPALERILDMIDDDPHWRKHVPLSEYRVRGLEYVLAQAPLSEVGAWVERYAPATADAGEREDDAQRLDRLQTLINRVDDVTARGRQTVF